MAAIGITLGDQAGIGPEIVDAALASGQLDPAHTYRIIGQRDETIVPGEPTAHSARLALDALEESVALLKSGEIEAVATAPVGKINLHEIGFSYPGQTEFFAHRLDCQNYAMCLTGERLTVGLVTIHCPLADVPDALTKGEIVRIGHLLGDFCAKRYHRPARVAVCGLNPHAGEGGAFGDEEIEIISPAVAELALQGKNIFTGPHPPDTIFYAASQGEHDAVLCMYHDQGLIPLKLLDFATGVNTTLGLPFPRTSPDHGTAYGIAGTGQADASSMICAIRLAGELV